MLLHALDGTTMQDKLGPQKTKVPWRCPVLPPIPGEGFAHILPWAMLCVPFLPT